MESASIIDTSRLSRSQVEKLKDSLLLCLDSSKFHRNLQRIKLISKQGSPPKSNLLYNLQYILLNAQRSWREELKARTYDQIKRRFSNGLAVDDIGCMDVTYRLLAILETSKQYASGCDQSISKLMTKLRSKEPWKDFEKDFHLYFAWQNEQNMLFIGTFNQIHNQTLEKVNDVLTTYCGKIKSQNWTVSFDVNIISLIRKKVHA